MTGAPKVLILAEMATLLGVGLLNSKPGEDGWLAFALGKQGLGRVAAVAVLLTILMLLADLGLGWPAAIVGGIVTVSYLVAHGTTGAAVLDLEKRVFG